MKKVLHILACMSLISPVIFGCASTRAVPEPNIPSSDALSTIDGLSKEFPESMRLMSKIDYVDELNAKRVVGQDLILSAQNPLNMRITISAFDKAISTLVSDGTGFSMIDVAQNVFVTGLATPENIAQILPVFLSAADLYRVIYGMYPTDGLVPDAESVQIFAWDEKSGLYRRSLPMKNGLVENVFYKWPEGDIVKITVNRDDELLYIYEASGFKSIESGSKSYRYPNTITFKLPPQKTDVRLRIENRDLDVEFSPAVFNLKPPVGANIIYLSTDNPVQNLAADAELNPENQPQTVNTENQTASDAPDSLENTQNSERVDQELLSEQNGNNPSDRADDLAGSDNTAPQSGE